MKISIFTPSHDSSLLAEAYRSILAQTYQDWEWIVLFNNGAQPVTFGDSRVQAHYAYNAPPWVGPLKAAACDLATGDILLELDHDDILMPTALEEVAAAFSADPEIGFVYSNTIHAWRDPANGLLSKVERFDERFGWRYRELEVNGVTLDEHVSFEPAPDSISRIWFAPNHLRAFRRDVYRQVGGYNREMRVLDDLDLMCRMYSATSFHHIDKGLYVYRVHGQNTWLRHNAEIQENVYRIHDRYAASLAERWAERSGLRKIELGGRMAAKPGYETVDLKDADLIFDLNRDWPLPDSSIGVVRAFDVFEHLRDPLHTMRQLYRVLAPGGWAFVQVPSTDGRGAFQDPTHASFWNENSFHYYTRESKAKYIDAPVRFQTARLYTTPKDEEQVCWTIAHLVSLKDGYRPAGLVEI